MPFLSNRQIAGLCLRLGTLLHAGLPLSDADRLIRHQGPDITAVVREIADGSCLGKPLHEILAETERFPTYVTGLLETGNASGRTEDALAALAAYYDGQARRARRVKSAVLYPSMLLLLMLGIIAVLLVKVLPVFDSVYASLGASMTGVAGSLLRTGQALAALMPVLCVVLGLAALSAALLVLNRKLRDRAASVFLSRFGDRGVLRRMNDAKIAQAMAMGLHSGMALDCAVEMAAGLVSDVPSAEIRCRHGADLMRGEGSDTWLAMVSMQVLPEDACELLCLGQRSGQLDAVADQVAGQLSDDADAALDGLVAKIEPAMVISAALLVGMILVAVMLPLMDIMSAIM